MHYGARQYDPVARRFAQPDTIVPDPANPQDLNRYTYTRNNPYTYSDPTGHIPYEGTGEPQTRQATGGVTTTSEGREYASLPAEDNSCRHDNSGQCTIGSGSLVGPEGGGVWKPDDDEGGFEVSDEAVRTAGHLVVGVGVGATAAAAAACVVFTAGTCGLLIAGVVVTAAAGGPAHREVDRRTGGREATLGSYYLLTGAEVVGGVACGATTGAGCGFGGFRHAAGLPATRTRLAVDLTSDAVVWARRAAAAPWGPATSYGANQHIQGQPDLCDWASWC